MTTQTFSPNVRLIDSDGFNRGRYLMKGNGELAYYMSEDVWENGGRPISARELNEWGWTFSEL